MVAGWKCTGFWVLPHFTTPKWLPGCQMSLPRKSEGSHSAILITGFDDNNSHFVHILFDHVRSQNKSGISASQIGMTWYDHCMTRFLHDCSRLEIHSAALTNNLRAWGSSPSDRYFDKVPAETRPPVEVRGSSNQRSRQVTSILLWVSKFSVLSSCLGSSFEHLGCWLWKVLDLRNYWTRQCLKKLLLKTQCCETAHSRKDWPSSKSNSKLRSWVVSFGHFAADASICSKNIECISDLLEKKLVQIGPPPVFHLCPCAHCNLRPAHSSRHAEERSERSVLRRAKRCWLSGIIQSFSLYILGSDALVRKYDWGRGMISGLVCPCLSFLKK